MKKSDIFLRSLINSVSTFAYTFLVAFFMYNGEKIFGASEKSFLIPLVLLLLLIISASVTGTLVLWKPIRLYTEGFKKEAFCLFFATLIWLLVFASIVVALILIF